LKRADRIVAAILIFISIFVLIETSKFPKYELRGIKLPGPTFFPNLLAIFLLMAAAYLIINSFMNKKSERVKTNISVWGIGNIILLILLIISFTYIVDYLGFLSSLFLITFVMFLKLKVNLIKAIIHSAIITFLIFLIFQELFRVPLPVNPLGF